MKTKLLMFALFLMVFATSCHNDDIDETVAAKTKAGYIYTTTNGDGINQVVRFTRYSDGSLDNEQAFSTNSKGGANVGAGGDAHGDFDAQGAIQIIDNFLLNVNAGGNTISVFTLNKSTGDLTLSENVNSGGTRPVSISYIKKTGETNNYWVVVGNQWNNPNIQKDGTSIERYPNNEWFNTNLTNTDATDQERNITLFSFNSSTGKLVQERVLDTYVRANGGPTTVSFNRDGSKLAVSTWGIAHFMTKMTSVTEQRPSRVYVYDFSNGGTISNKRYFEESGIAGTIGFSWSKLDSNTIFASNFNLIPEKRDNSITVLKDNGANVVKTANFGATGNNTDINEACWTALSPSGNRLYVSSFGSNLISTFNVNPTGIQYLSFEKRKDNSPAGDTKDMYVTSDNKFMYALGSFQSFSINTFEIKSDGVNYKSQNVLKSTTPGGPGKYNFLGLNGFDL